jgi:hypothetical protein
MDYSIPDLSSFLDWTTTIIGTVSQYNEAGQEISQIGSPVVSVKRKYVTLWQHFVLQL